MARRAINPCRGTTKELQLVFFSRYKKKEIVFKVHTVSEHQCHTPSREERHFYCFAGLRHVVLSQGVLYFLPYDALLALRIAESEPHGVLIPIECFSEKL